jgi:DNA repair protein REV1
MAKPLQSSASADSSDFWGSDDPAFLEALGKAVLPGDVNPVIPVPQPDTETQSRKRPRDESDEIQVETTSYSALTNTPGGTEDPEIYGASRFGHFGEYMHRKRAKLQIQNANLEASQDVGRKSKIFSGLSIYVRIS